MRQLPLWLGALSVLSLWVFAEGRAAAVAADRPDPVYAGRPLGYWLRQAASTHRREPAGRVVAPLGRALADPVPEVRVAAADALGAMGSAAAPVADALAGLLSDDSPWVRVAAMETLGGLGRHAVSAVVGAFQRGEGAVRVRAVLVLGSMGSEAEPAIPALEEALEDPRYADIRDRVVTTLELIRRRPAERPFRRSTQRRGLDSSTPVPPPPDDAVSVLGVPTDWPQFHGPWRDAICRETGLLAPWPEGGPQLLWKLEGLGHGFSSVSIAQGSIFTMGDRPGKDGQPWQYVMAYDLNTQQELWAAKVGPPHKASSGGPRSTPTVDGDRVYVIGTDGDLVCVDSRTGRQRWRRNLVRDFGGRMMSGWKYSESPLVDGDRLVCTPGGKDATLVALDKYTGEVIWKCAVPPLGRKGKDGAAYSSMVVADIHGVRQYVQLIGRGVVGVEAQSGRFLWGYNRVANNVANIPTPVVRNDLVFATTSYRTGCALLKIARHGDRFRAEEVYFHGPDDPATHFENHHGGVVVVRGYLYGGHGPNRGEPVCLELTTGRVAWRAEPLARGSAAVLYAEGHVIFRYDRGLVALVEATPEAFRVKSSFTPVTADGPAWAHPVIHQGRLYLRHDDLLLCYDLRQP